MAVAHDATSTGLLDAAGTSLTFSHTCSGASRYIVVAVGCNSPANPSGVTYAGSALALLGTTQESPTGYRLSLWGLKQPGTGVNNVVITWATAVVAAASASTFTGVHQTTSTGTYAGASGTSTAPSIGITDSTDDDMVIDGMVWSSAGGGATAVVGSLQTQRANQDATNVNAASSTEPGAPGTVTMSWVLSASRNWAIGAITLFSDTGPTYITISRIVVPILGARRSRTDASVAQRGWTQQGPEPIVITGTTDFFCCNDLG